MRLTLNIPNDLYRELRQKAAEEGIAVQEVILRIIEKQVRASRRKLPILASKRPGTLKLDNERIYDLIDFP